MSDLQARAEELRGEDDGGNPYSFRRLANGAIVATVPRPAHVPEADLASLTDAFEAGRAHERSVIAKHVEERRDGWRCDGQDDPDWLDALDAVATRLLSELRPTEEPTEPASPSAGRSAVGLQILAGLEKGLADASLQPPLPPSRAEEPTCSLGDECDDTLHDHGTEEPTT